MASKVLKVLKYVRASMSDPKACTIMADFQWVDASGAGVRQMFGRAHDEFVLNPPLTALGLRCQACLMGHVFLACAEPHSDGRYTAPVMDVKDVARELLITLGHTAPDVPWYGVLGLYNDTEPHASVLDLLDATIKRLEAA